MKKLNAYELAHLLKVSHQTVYNWIEKGLPVSKINDGWKTVTRFDLDDCKLWVSENITKKSR